eukprot:scaffold881_cov65-Phaeocystis_antarctica.AAC.4
MRPVSSNARLGRREAQNRRLRPALTATPQPPMVPGLSCSSRVRSTARSLGSPGQGGKLWHHQDGTFHTLARQCGSINSMRSAHGAATTYIGLQHLSARAAASDVQDRAAASGAQGCSLGCPGLQPRVPRAAASGAQGCSLECPGLQPRVHRAATSSAQGCNLE